MIQVRCKTLTITKVNMPYFNVVIKQCDFLIFNKIKFRKVFYIIKPLCQSQELPTWYSKHISPFLMHTTKHMYHIALPVFRKPAKIKIGIIIVTAYNPHKITFTVFTGF